LGDKAHGREQKEGLSELFEQKLRADVRYKELQGELHQLKKDVAEGRYLLAEEVLLDYARFFVVFKKFAQAIPGRVAGQLTGHIDSVAARAVEREIAGDVAGMLASFVVAGQSAADFGTGQSTADANAESGPEISGKKPARARKAKPKAGDSG